MAGIRVEGVSKSYRMADGSEREVLNDIDLTVGDGEFVCLLGPSGCGKTTLLNIMSGVDRNYRGNVHFTDVRSGRPAQRTPAAGNVNGSGRKSAGPVFSYMFQESRLLPWLTVRENLRFVLDEEGRGNKGRALIDEWLGRVGLSGSASDFPGQLSVGMQQRAALARALMIGPEVLFMDEPLSSLDELTALRMRDELLSLWMEQQPTVVFVTHNPLEAVYLGDRVLVMSPGPGQLVDEIRPSDNLPRPRDSEDPQLWKLSRKAVRILKGVEREQGESATGTYS